MKVKHLQTPRVEYLAMTPTGECLRFDSWVELCETALELGQQKALQELAGEIEERMCHYSDMMIDSAKEIPA